VYYDLKASFTVAPVRWACAMFLRECSIIAHNPCGAKGDLKTYSPYPSDLGIVILIIHNANLLYIGWHTINSLHSISIIIQ
jgi:hypothetical protein